ncbi:biotin--[acetyl-CoA-carboxylase] ligase [Sulfitobacter alexandrii]|uniref:biotin--[biotin carboxyl-carrier protein] ligase n=1 Tax=Sulfitobacter alexandrii TaxID=1917485 RepID=A0A1J0WG75_9RHOB|nr:biotin--[acetyl-CoA-carboxylase] ligase [Sulfitobacter alexandrii]APE43134.1 biotin--[acetyl-CoA-carboxylase] ligase [Sulfitobacter alexandrii]
MAWPDGYNRHVLDSVDSTLAEAARRLSAGASAEWILALEQTAARGRRGRSWSTPRGNFAATLILPCSEPPARAALRSFVSSLALYRAFEEVTGLPGSFALKWPNDVLLNGGKVAGILLEASGSTLLIGIGVNLANAPAAAEVEAGAVTPVSIAAELGIDVAPEVFLDVLASEYAVLEDRFSTYGFEPIRTAWMAHAARRGEVIRARTARHETRGVFEDVDDQGNLILGTEAGRVPIAAADVFF